MRLFRSRADDVLGSTAWYKQATPRCTGTMRIRDVRASQRGTIHSSPHMVLELSQSALRFLFNRPLVACRGWHLQTAQGYHLALSRAQSPGPALDLDCVLDPESCAEVDQNIKQQLNVAG